MIHALTVSKTKALKAELGQRFGALANISEVREIIGHRAVPAVSAKCLFDLFILIFGNVEGEQGQML